ncbi:MAG: acetyltransferase [Clostridia bacterium BRH_c25]|nr:MAG: acetyltransferase [Clostridia bacterium BRH_c25]
MKQLQLRSGATMVIRKAAKSDADGIVEYIETISGESDNLTFGPGEFEMSIEKEAEFLDSIATQNNAIYLVAEIGGKIVGSLHFSGGARPRTAHVGEFGVSVLKEHWGNGIGTELIRYLLEWSKETGIIRKINLRVRTDNFNAISVYKKLGFTQEGIITRDLLINGEFHDMLLMGYHVD